VVTKTLDSLLGFRSPAPSFPTYDSFWTVAVLLRKLNSETRGVIEGRKETKLTEKTIERTEVTELLAPIEEPTLLDVPNGTPAPGTETGATNGRRERRSRRNSSPVEPFDPERATPDVTDLDGASSAIGAQPTDREARRAANRERRRRPTAPRAEGMAAADSDTTVDEDQPTGDLVQLPDSPAITADMLAVDLSGKKLSRTARTLKRAQRKQQEAAAAVADADPHPALGALNRHLNMMTQQLGVAHRVIGRLAAERDALRQQLADLQGIPVEEIVVTSIGASSGRSSKEDRSGKSREPSEPEPETGMARFNYFRHEDIEVMRKRRQLFALLLLGVVVMLWLLGRMGFWQLPANLSRDSLANLPLVGELMSYFLAGWVLYRIVRVGGRGVKWVFPSDQRRRRR
jgi:hypothetical protein